MSICTILWTGWLILVWCTSTVINDLSNFASSPPGTLLAKNFPRWNPCLWTWIFKFRLWLADSTAANQKTEWGNPCYQLIFICWNGNGVILIKFPPLALEVVKMTNSSAASDIFHQNDDIYFNTFRARQNGRHFPDDIFKAIFLNENI